MITGHTKLYGIVANPIHHIKTPQEMNRLFGEISHDGVLVPFHVLPDNLALFMDSLRGMENLGGMIVTVPHKVPILALCDRLEGDAADIGAVNVIRREADGALVGAMMDGKGFVGGLRAAGIEVAGMDICQLGAGGAGAAVAFALAEAGARRLNIVNRSEAKAQDLARRIAARYPVTQVTTGPAETTSRDMIVNTTSLGMKEGDPLPIDDTAFHDGQIVAEVIMQPEITPILALAQQKGARTHPGRPMLREQVRLMARHLGVPGA